MRWHRWLLRAGNGFAVASVAALLVHTVFGTDVNAALFGAVSLLVAITCWALYGVVNPSARVEPFRGRAMPVLLGSLVLGYLLILLIGLTS
jgi:drug/metabolite transporter (DMT)-like permease